MSTINFDREWNFVTGEINTSNKGGTEKGILLFEFQSLLSVISMTKTPREKQMLASIYQERKKRYKKLRPHKAKRFWWRGGN